MAATVVAPRPTHFLGTCSCLGQHTPTLVTVLAVVERDVVVGQLLLADGATCLCLLATSVSSHLALGRS